VIAQDKTDFKSWAEDVKTKFLEGMAAALFIITFIVILLAIGGVLKRPSVGIPSSLILFIILIIGLFVVPMFIPYPQTLDIPENFKKGGEIKGYTREFLIMLGLPSEWMYVPAIIYLFVLPFAAIYTLVWAFLQSLGIFSNVPSSVNRVLAFIIAFLAIPMGWFVKLVWVLFSFMGAWSVVIFVATFVVGIFFRGLTKARGELEEYKKFVSKRKEELRTIISKLKTAKEGTLDVIKNAITEVSDKVKEYDMEAYNLLQMARSVDSKEKATDPLSKAIERLEKLL